VNCVDIRIISCCGGVLVVQQGVVVGKSPPGEEGGGEGELAKAPERVMGMQEKGIDWAPFQNFGTHHWSQFTNLIKQSITFLLT